LIPSADPKFHSRKKICDALDALIFELKQIIIDEQILEALAHAAPSSAMPLVRNHLYLHALDWLKRKGNPFRHHKAAGAFGDHETESNCGGLSTGAFSSLRRLSILGLTDVWSATRKGCAGRLAAISLLLDGTQLESLAAGLLDRYQQASASAAAASAESLPSSSPSAGGGSHARQEWREKEGCLLGLAALLRLPRWSHCGGDGDGPPGKLRERLTPILFQAGRAHSTRARTTPSIHLISILLCIPLARLQCRCSPHRRIGGLRRSLVDRDPLP
jgi:hypothetical protein